MTDYIENRADLIKSSRIKSGYTQKQISDMMGFGSAQHVSNMERGQSAIGRDVIKMYLKEDIISYKDYKKAHIKDFSEFMSDIEAEIKMEMKKGK